MPSLHGTGQVETFAQILNLCNGDVGRIFHITITQLTYQWAYDRKRFVYANRISETAEKSRAGVVSVSSSIMYFFSGMWLRVDERE